MNSEVKCVGSAEFWALLLVLPWAHSFFYFACSKVGRVGELLKMRHETIYQYNLFVIKYFLRNWFSTNSLSASY
jgi:hypothetical protein